MSEVHCKRHGWEREQHECAACAAERDAVYDAAMARHKARRRAAESTWSREVQSPHGADMLAAQEADCALDEACERAEEAGRG